METSLLDEEELCKIAEQLGSRSFRMGIHLGLEPHELELLQTEARSQALSPWQLNRKMLHQWRQRQRPESERTELSRALKRLGMGRLAAEMQPSVNGWQETSYIDPARHTLSARELEEVSRSLGDCWERLAIHLNVPDDRVQAFKSGSEETCIKAFRCLWAWREASQNASREDLATALRKVNKGRLASQIYRTSTK